MEHEINEVKQLVEKPDSIKVSRNGKGNFSFEIKRYFCAETTSATEIVKELRKIQNKLLETFPNKEV